MRAKFGSEEQAMVTSDMNFPEPIGACRAAALMTFKRRTDRPNELFFDARPFEKKNGTSG